MTDDERRVAFIARCPNGHFPTQDLAAGVLRRNLDAGSLQLSCILCDTQWSATADEMVNARKILDRETK